LRQGYWFSAVALLASLSLLIVHGLVPEKFQVDETTIALLIIALVALLLPLLPVLARYLREMRVPGVQLSFRDQLEDAARRLSAMPVPAAEAPSAQEAPPEARFEIPSGTAAAAEEDPNLSVTRISMELERFLRDALRDLDLLPAGPALGLRDMTQLLMRDGRINNDEAGLLDEIRQMRNRAVHGEFITPADAALFASLVRELLHRLAWLAPTNSTSSAPRR
jgi:hypothetical protein